MAQSPYREPFKLDTKVEITVEKAVAEAIKIMSQHTQIPEGELVNTAMRRFMATHSDYFPKSAKKKV
jgi:hypothetical protein